MEAQHPAARRIFLQSSAVAIASLVLGPDTASAKHRTVDYTKKFQLGNKSDLETLIRKMSPYQGGGDYYIDLQGVEYHNKPGNWNFKGGSHGIARAVRVPYTFCWTPDTVKREGGDDCKDNEVEVRDYFLIGFEGGAGY